MMRYAAIFSLVLSVFGSGSRALADREYAKPPRLEELTPEQQELMRKAMSLAIPLAEERITYHYGKPDPCEKLVASGTYAGEVFDKYSRLSEKGGAVAGHGVYIAGNPLSSISYFSGGGLQVVLGSGTPMIDLTDPEVRRRMLVLGLDRSDIYNLPLDAVVRYNERSDWYVVKGATGVRFEPIDFSKMPDADFSGLLDGIRYQIAFERMSSGVRAGIVARINAPSPKRGKIAARWFFSDSSTSLERFAELAPESRREALDQMRADGRLKSFFGQFPNDFGEPEHAEAVRSAFAYLRTLGPETGDVLAAFLMHHPHRSRERFLALPSGFRSLAIRGSMENGALEALQDMLQTRSYTPESEAAILNEAKALLRGDLAARFSGGAAGAASDVRALLLLATVDQGKWVKDHELQAWVDALSAAERKELETRLAMFFTKIERGAGSGIAPSRSDFLPMGRVVSALNPSAGPGRNPSATSESRALAGRYLDLLGEKYAEKKPVLPRLSKSALEQSCRSALSRTLSGLAMGGPMIAGVAGSLGISFWDAYRKVEARQALQSLCEGEGGSYLNPSDGGPGGCRCTSGRGSRDITWTWDSIGNRDPQSGICVP